MSSAPMAADLGRNSKRRSASFPGRRPPHSRPPVAVSPLQAQQDAGAAAAWFPALTTWQACRLTGIS